jgi:hypothetical protein
MEHSVHASVAKKAKPRKLSHRPLEEMTRVTASTLL